MNQIKIGAFIAECRHKVGLTQEELATKLGITKNAVSKWERGLGLMDMSLLKPLSILLNVSINEILAGEKINKDNYLKIADENIINLTELIELRTMRYGIIGMSLFFMLLTIISAMKDINPSALVSLLCVYNSITFLTRYKLTKDKSNLAAGILFFIAVICNTISFILM